jgi:hypothetical protein
MTAAEVARAWREHSVIRGGYVIVCPGDHACQWRETLDDRDIVAMTRQDLFCSRKVAQYFAFDAKGAAFVIDYDADTSVYRWKKFGE